jgi:uncharacterized protein YkwD
MRFDRATQLTITAALALASLFATSTAAHAAAGFGDVDADQFYTEAVQWMVDRDLTTGSAPGCFSPDRAVTRAEIATFLHRFAGAPTGGSEPFVDVASGSYYRDAVAWMVEAGITTGTSATTFEPNRAVTRAEIATFLYRFAGSPRPAVDFTRATRFSDTPTDAFYTDAVSWMVAAGVTTGTSATTFEPYRAVTRAESATFLHRMAGAPAVNVDPGGKCGEPVSDDLVVAEARSLALLNQVRTSAGVAPLTRSAEMDRYARDWSRTMSEGGFFAHSGGPYGENIVWWSNENLSPEEAAQRFHEMWVDSAGHYRNMTLAGYTKVGIGLWRDENGWHGTHVFAF